MAPDAAGLLTWSTGGCTSWFEFSCQLYLWWLVLPAANHRPLKRPRWSAPTCDPRRPRLLAKDDKQITLQTILQIIRTLTPVLNWRERNSGLPCLCWVVGVEWWCDPADRSEPIQKGGDAHRAPHRDGRAKQWHHAGKKKKTSDQMVKPFVI